MKLAQRGLRLRLAGVAAPARQRPLGRMGAQARGAPGQQKRRSRARLGLGERDGDRGPLQRGRDRTRRCARERGTELCNIPPGGIVKWPDHPA